MNSVYLVILIFLIFPMIVVYDKSDRTRFLMCGLLYYLIEAIKKYLIGNEQKEKNNE